MDDEILQVKILTERLAAIGTQLLQRLHNLHMPDSQLPKEIATWIHKATNQILPLMPEDCPDYAALDTMRNQYTVNQGVLLPSAENDLRKVLENIRIAADCVCATLIAEPRNIPRQRLAIIGYDGLKYSLDEVTKSQLIQHLKGKEDGMTAKTAMLNVYGKICLWILSMVKLNEPVDCLALAGSVRAILELYVDLNLFSHNSIQNAAEKFFSFLDVEKWRVANIISSAPQQFTAIDEYLDRPENSKANIEAIKVKLWGKDRKGNPVKAKHWTNKYLWERVFVLLDDKEVTDIYLSSYYYCNWLIHPMYFDLINDLENVHLLSWYFYDLSRKMFLSATQLINEEIKVLTKEDLKSIIESVEKKYFKLFFGEMVKAGRNSI